MASEQVPDNETSTNSNLVPTNFVEIGERAFPRYVAESLNSPVPLAFFEALTGVQEQLKVDGSTSRYSGLKYPESEIALRIFQTPFSDRIEAFYAVTYGVAISMVKDLRATNVKTRDKIREGQRAMEENLTQNLRAYSQRFNMQPSELVKYLDLLPISPMEALDIEVTMMETEMARTMFESMIDRVSVSRQRIVAAVGIPAAVEERVPAPVNGTPLDRVLHRWVQKLAGTVTENDLAATRDFVNGYFSKDRNVSRINFLALSH